MLQYAARVVYPSLLILLLAAVAPFVLLLLYVHPSADDYCYASSLAGADFWNAGVSEYTGWKGRYAAIALTVAYHSPGGMLLTYGPALALFLAALSLALYLFVRAAAEAALSRAASAFLALGLGALYLGTMPKVPATLYWLDGALQYQLGGIFLLLALAALLILYRRGGSAAACLACACLFVAIGATEIAMLVLAAVTGVMAFNRICLRGEDRLLWSAVVVVTLASAALLLLAPGNYVRAEHAAAEAHQFWFAFSHAWYYAGVTLASWLGEPLLWLATLAFVPAALRLVHLHGVREDAGGARLALSAVLLPGLVWACFFGLWWAAATNPPGRALNLIYLAFLAGWFLTVLELVAVLARRQPVALVEEVFPPGLRLAHLAVMVLFGATLLWDGHAHSAWGDLWYRAAAYDQTMNQRYARIAAAKSGAGNARPDMAFQAIEDPPEVLLYTDIQNDRRNWRNTCFARYFGLGAVVRR